MVDNIPPAPFVVPELWAALVARYERPFTIAQPTWWCWTAAKHAPPVGKLPNLLPRIGIPIPEAVTALNWDAVLHTLSRFQIAHQTALAQREGHLTLPKSPEPNTPEERLAGIIQWCLRSRRRATVGFHVINKHIERQQKLVLMTDIERTEFLEQEKLVLVAINLRRNANKARCATIEDIERLEGLGHLIPKKPDGSYDYKALARQLALDRDLHEPLESPQFIIDPALADVDHLEHMES